MLEGLLRGRAGLFPANCVQEVKLRNPDAIRQQQVRKKTNSSPNTRQFKLFFQDAISAAPLPAAAASGLSRVLGRRDVRGGGGGGGSVSSTPTMQRAKSEREIFEEAMKSKAKL